ncbi:uncharacterized protein Triagg1_520 [Trichoderma aggressivum f. europaeum]|uniref:Uncharacterized protein n=1 Tax=Trichoderma aggressivum f. europaeum TaxID=173218 RepID=A0AAE1IM37_9HYPO|nr:hypothetical protein Triagg1_520 [Trichoderma aggressivum f. europaeum]
MAAAVDEVESKAELAIPFDAPIKARNRKTYASFGEDGLTATANAHGHLIQITRYFGNEPSGFICVDLPKAPEPFRVAKRMKELQRSCEDSQKGMRLKLPERPTSESPELDDAFKWGVREDEPKLRFYQDRWPSFVPRNPWLDSEIQYFISGKTVYQIYTFSSVEGIENDFPKKFPPLIISANLFLRHLDFVTKEKSGTTWNGHSLDQRNAERHYAHSTTADAKTIFVKHRDCETGRGKNDAILFISPYIDDRSQSVGPIEHSPDYQIHPDDKALADLVNNKRVKITLAYTLELVSPTDDISNSLSEGALPPLQPKDYTYEPPVFASDPHLNFTLRRNLEHILSVCSIPIRARDESKAEIIPIALTCGDISGHRVTKEASFYAFQYLLKAFEHFDNSDLKDIGGRRLDSHPLELGHEICENPNCQMRFRIWKTCLGHLAWIYNHMNKGYTMDNMTGDGTTGEAKAKKGLVSPHYWASGQVIDWKKYPWKFFDKEITDAPMQIIKFGEFCRITGSDDILREIPGGLRNIAKHWVKSLHERNKGGSYAFPRIKEEETGKFYLADHALIWWASKSLEELGLDSELEVASGQRMVKYSSDEIKTNFIKRFTMENPALKTRMIAISRSSAETRFSLLMRETVLFYAMDLGLFDVEANEGSNSTDSLTGSSSFYANTNNANGTSNETNETLVDSWENVIEEWTNTVDYQTQLEDQNDAHWNHPLQFALSIIMSANHKSTNSRLAAWMFKHSRSILLTSSSPNGLFPGQLDVYKRPVLFDREPLRDGYWQATFEVPFILWKYLIPPPSVKGSSFSLSGSVSSDARGLENIMKLLPGMNSSGIPNNVIDQGKVVTLSDEWLYNELDCFRKKIDLSKENMTKLSRKYIKNTRMADMIVIRRVAQKIQDAVAQNTTADNTAPQGTTLQGTTLQGTQEDILGYIIDVPRKSDKRQDTPKRVEIKSAQSLNKTISRKRTTKNAKKRLLHFHRATDKTALICYISAIEHPDISAFFDKHMTYDKHFHEETNAVLNLWVTELHLSFYQTISQEISPDMACIPRFECYSFPRRKNEEAGNRKLISRAVMSFRFDGDFFDRHWTCHFFEFNPYRIHGNEIADVTKEKITGSLKANPWKQRRVLELVLFGKILQEMVTCSQDLLDEIKTRILESFKKRPKKEAKNSRLSSTFLDSIDLFDDITSNVFISNNKAWNIFQYILQVVEEDLCDNLTKIELWTKREERPEHNKPRWTLNDERNYRGAIYRLQKSNDLLVQQLRLCYTRARSFNASLTKRLDSTRGEWEVGSNDDIRLFTYVTVVFLPISFATGVFSMSSAPTKETLNSMITTAGLALLVTAMTLLNAKVLDRKIVKPFLAKFRPISEATTQLVLRSPLYVFGLLYRLAHLSLISLVSFLPEKWIYLLHRYLISPTEESSSTPYNVAYQTKSFLDKGIEEKVQKITEKIAGGKLAEEIKPAQRKEADQMKLAQRKQAEEMKLAQKREAVEMKVAQKKQTEELKLAQKREAEEMKSVQRQQAQEGRRRKRRWYEGVGSVPPESSMA